MQQIVGITRVSSSLLYQFQLKPLERIAIFLRCRGWFLVLHPIRYPAGSLETVGVTENINAYPTYRIASNAPFQSQTEQTRCQPSSREYICPDPSMRRLKSSCQSSTRRTKLPLSCAAKQAECSRNTTS